MKQGDFTELAKNYIHRPGYSKQIVKAMTLYIEHHNGTIKTIADVGSGTGKFTRVIAEEGYKVFAVEPNNEMRSEGILFTSDLPNVQWMSGSGENTGLADGCVEWATMASSFHWTDPTKSLPEFARILKPDGFFTAIWNPRDIEKSEFHQMIEQKIYELCPSIERVSSGSKKHAPDWAEVLVSTGHFAHPIFMEVQDEIVMTPERYQNVWRSVNDIRAQAGEAVWEKIIEMIDHESSQMSEIITPYKNRAWTVQKVNH